MAVNKIVRPMAMVFLALLVAAGVLGLAMSVEGQVMVVAQPGFPGQPPGMEPTPSPGTAAQFSAIKLVEDPQFRQAINVARDYISDGVWKEALNVLQILLDKRENSYVQIREKGADGRDTVRWTSVKFEANNLLRTLPDEALDMYELLYGAAAKDLLDEAKKKGDREQLAHVAQQHQYTRAGIEANDLLATTFLDRGQFFMAALRLEKLLAMNPRRVKLSDMTVFKAALAYRRACDVKKADEVWKRLEPNLISHGGLKIGDEVVAIDRLKEMLAENAPTPVSVNPHDWPSIRGNDRNSAQANGSQPLLDAKEKIWSRPTILDKESGGSTEPGEAAAKAIDAAIKQQTDQNNPIMSGFFTIAAGRQAIYRTYRDIRAVYLYDGLDSHQKDRKVSVGEIAWKCLQFDGSLVPALENGKYRGIFGPWLDNFNRMYANSITMVNENSLLGSISTDQRYVYAIDDLSVPAGNAIWNQGNVSQEVRSLVMQNSLCAFNLYSGKYEWRLGVSALDQAPNSKDDPFADSHFLSVPISIGGKLYVLNEKNAGMNGEADLRLVCIDPNKKEAVQNGPARPTVLEVQNLGTVQQQSRFTHDINRRISAAHLAYGDGILVCPTNAGEVIGIDLLSRGLAWSYPYREQAPAPTQPFNQPFPGPFGPRPFQPQMPVSPPNWKPSPPVLADGKVVFTAPDASSVHCISLRDGTPLWKRKQMEGDLFLAGVFQDRVLIVGRNAIRALRLTDGSQMWYVSTGKLPSGQGVASKNIYYLPLQKGEILAVDVERGIVKSHNRARSEEIATNDADPGNLLFYEGMVLSQTPKEIVAYPQLTAKLEVVTKRLEADPKNPVRMVERGELLLADGQVQLAVDDLRLALQHELPPEMRTRAKQGLYDALSDLLQVDFKTAGPKYLNEYEILSKVPEDPQRQELREAKFFRIVGQGHESVGNLVEAFQMFRKFGSLKINREQGVSSPEDPMHKVPTNVWLRGRIASMMANATKAEQKIPLENTIAEEWKLVKAKKDLDAIRSFVDMFDVPVRRGPGSQALPGRGDHRPQRSARVSRSGAEPAAAAGQRLFQGCQHQRPRPGRPRQARGEEGLRRGDEAGGRVLSGAEPGLSQGKACRWPDRCRYSRRSGCQPGSSCRTWMNRGRWWDQRKVQRRANCLASTAECRVLSSSPTAISTR